MTIIQTTAIPVTITNTLPAEHSGNQLIRSINMAQKTNDTTHSNPYITVQKGEGLWHVAEDALFNKLINEDPKSYPNPEITNQKIADMVQHIRILNKLQSDILEQGQKIYY